MPRPSWSSAVMRTESMTVGRLDGPLPLAAGPSTSSGQACRATTLGPSTGERHCGRNCEVAAELYLVTERGRPTRSLRVRMGDADTRVGHFDRSLQRGAE